MSEQHSAFQRLHVEKAAAEPVEGMLEQLGLPPAVVEYIHKNKRTIWIVTGCIAAVVVAVSLYGSYSSYRHEKAASALSEALKAEGSEKEGMLEKVIDDYGSTSSGLWARIELAHSYSGDGDSAKALNELLPVRKEVSKSNPVTPLLLANIAGLYEKNDEPDQAIAVYKELEGYQGFAEIAQKALGRLYEQQGNTEQALSMYQKYLASGEKEGASAAADPDRDIIKSKVAALQN